MINTLFSAILLADIGTELNESEEVITYLKSYRQSGRTGGGGWRVFGFMTNKGQYPCSRELYMAIYEGDSVTVYKTKFLREATKIRINDIEYRHGTYSIYNWYYLFPIVCIVSTILAFIFRNRNRKKYETCLILSSILTIYLTISIFTNNTV